MYKFYTWFVKFTPKPFWGDAIINEIILLNSFLGSPLQVYKNTIHFI